MKRLIVTGDDFGASLEVNEAVERAHRDGILGSTSLMVAGPAARDAVERARRLPELAVGLHLVVTRGVSVLPPSQLPALVGRDGRFRQNLGAAGVAYFFSPSARRQLEREIRAQFEAFATTGLVLDHADVHNHMHLHPTVFSTLTRVGHDFGLRAIRLPYEPLTAGSPARCVAAWPLLRPWAAILKRRLRRHGYVCNDFLFGMAESGAIDAAVLERFVRGLPDGVSEIHLHPATAGWEDPDPDARPAARRIEFEALLSDGVRRAIAEIEAQRLVYHTLSTER